MNNKLIALIGPKRAGKDTVASMLRALWGQFRHKTVAMVHLADELRWRCPKNPDETKEEYRVRLQNFGAEMREHHGDEGWLVDLVLKPYPRRTPGPSALTLVADVRKEAEVKKIRARWGRDCFIIKVMAKPYTRKLRSDDPDSFVLHDKDSTEVEAIHCGDYDFLVNNDGDFVELMGEVIKLFREVSR